MEGKTNKIITAILAICLMVISFYCGKYSSKNEIAEKQNRLEEVLKQQDLLQTLNQGSIEKLNILDNGTIFVIGHKSPDTDTVCSAIAYASLLQQLGYDAKAMVSGELNRETAFILKYAGVETPEELIDASAKNIFLVDHSEYSQSVDGMEDAHIVGIIDHHGIGTVTTGHQVLYQARPIGSTATIVWLDHLNYGMQIDKTTALLLLGAVLSDTDNLTGSTTTETDKKAVEYLSELAEVADVNDYYNQMHVEKLSYDGMSSEQILFSDYKEYEAYGVKFGIGAVNAIDEQTADILAARMKEVLPEAIKTRDVDMMFASVGIRENGEKIDRIVPADERSKTTFENAFPNYDEYDGTSFIFKTGLGRKSLFVPGLTDYLGTHPHE